MSTPQATSSNPDSLRPDAPMAMAEEAGFPRAFGGYALLAAFAQGGMGEVFLAKSGGVAGIDRLCVLKKLRQDVTKNPEYVRRFLDEARVAVQLNHANICHTFDVGQVGTEYYLAMEYVSGVNLRKLLVRAYERGTVLEESVALYVLRETLEALDYAHRHRHPLTGKPLKVVHRDVSPQNVMLNYEGEVKLIDFGLAESELKEEQTESKVVMGKVAYMAPEQARGDAVDGRTDQFASAIIAYELLVGDRFYGDMSNYEIWQVVGRGNFLPRRWDTISPGLQEILGRALSAKFEDRFASCGAFQDAIDAYQAGNGRKPAQRLMQKLFASDHEAEGRFLRRFAHVKVPSTDELSPREGSNRPFVLDDKSRPTTMEEAAALAQALEKNPPATGTLTAEDVAAQAQTGAPLSGAPFSADGGLMEDPTELVRTRSDVKTSSPLTAPEVESSDTRAAAAAAYPVNNSGRWLAGAAVVGILIGVVVFLFLRNGPLGDPIEGNPGVIVDADKLAADKLAADKLAADKLAANKLATDKRAADKREADKRAADKLAADKLAAAAGVDRDAKSRAATLVKRDAAKAAAERVAAEKAAAEKLAAAEKAAADKAAADKLAAEKAAAKALKLPSKAAAPFSYAAARKAMQGCTQVCAKPHLRLMQGKTGTVPLVARTGIWTCARSCQN